jgi:hypothetical protein
MSYMDRPELNETEHQAVLLRLAELAEEATGEGPPLELEKVLRAEFARANRWKRSRKVPWAIAAAGAIAASFGFWFMANKPARTPPPPEPSVKVAGVQPVNPLDVNRSPAPIPPKPAVRHKQQAPSPAAKKDESAPFVAIPWTLPLAAGERAAVMRMDLPVSALISAGVPLAADPGGIASADVVVGEDGRAHAFRLLSISNSTLNPDRSVIQ